MKNTFLTVQEEDGSSPKVRPAKSMPLAFRPDGASPGGASLPLSPAGSPSRSPAHGGQDSEDSPASPCSPTLCHLRTLSLGSRAEGPHLGLLWAPEGHEWGPEMLVRTSLGQAVIQMQSPTRAAAPEATAPAPEMPAARPPSGDAHGGVFGRVWELSEDPQGCREVQQALEEGTGATRAAVAEELRGHIVDAMHSPYANFVLQKLVQLVPPASIGFMADELGPEEFVQASKHKFGCRIVQRLIEFWPASMTERLVEAIFGDFGAVARHPYGNYVVQNIMVNGTAEQQGRVIRLIDEDICSLCSDVFGCAVVVAVFTKGRPEDQLLLARSILREEGLLVFIACTRHGHVAATRILDMLSGQELDAARQALTAEMDALEASKFGRNVAALL